MAKEKIAYESYCICNSQGLIERNFRGLGTRKFVSLNCSSGI